MLAAARLQWQCSRCMLPSWAAFNTVPHCGTSLAVHVDDPGSVPQPASHLLYTTVVMRCVSVLLLILVLLDAAACLTRSAQVGHVWKAVCTGRGLFCCLGVPLNGQFQTACNPWTCMET
jgi:hypothetical protein